MNRIHNQIKQEMDDTLGGYLGVFLSRPDYHHASIYKSEIFGSIAVTASVISFPSYIRHARSDLCSKTASVVNLYNLINPGASKPSIQAGTTTWWSSFMSHRCCPPMSFRCILSCGMWTHISSPTQRRVENSSILVFHSKIFSELGRRLKKLIWGIFPNMQLLNSSSLP